MQGRRQMCWLVWDLGVGEFGGLGAPELMNFGVFKFRGWPMVMACFKLWLVVAVVDKSARVLHA